MQTEQLMQFPMTTSATVKGISVGTGVLVFVLLPLQLFAVTREVVPTEIKAPSVLMLLLVGGVLGITVLWAPRAVRVDAAHLAVERLGWPDFRVPLRDITRVEEGPAITVMGDVRRVAGNGGLLGFTGLYSVRGVGTVRCWATRLGRPTVVVHRVEGRPLLLGVDDGHALLAELRRRGVGRG